MNTSQWSSKEGLIDDHDEGCWIKYYYDERQDIVGIEIAFYKGQKNTRTPNVYDNGAYPSQIQSHDDTNVC